MAMRLFKKHAWELRMVLFIAAIACGTVWVSRLSDRSPTAKASSAEEALTMIMHGLKRRDANLIRSLTSTEAFDSLEYPANHRQFKETGLYEKCKVWKLTEAELAQPFRAWSAWATRQDMSSIGWLKE